MRSTTTLEARFRRLLLAYPRHHRQRRGEEILTTLMDGADPARERPELGDVIDVVRGGLKVRFGTAGGKFAVLLATVAALIGALGGLCAGSWAGWQTAPRLPERAAVQIATLAFPGAEPTDAWYQAYPYGYRYPLGKKKSITERIFGTASDLDGPETTCYFYDTILAGSGPRSRAVTAAAVVRLRQAGWRVDEQAGTIVATRNGVVANIVSDGVELPQFTVSMSSGPNGAAVMAATIAGAIMGLALGWVVGAWALRRLRRAGYPTRAVLGLLFGMACMALFPATTGIVLSYVPIMDGGDRPVWVQLQFFVCQLGIELAALVFTVILVTAWRVRPSSPPQRLSAT